MTSKYARTKILSFSDLTNDQQTSVIDLYDQEGAETDSYAILEDEAIPLSMFMRCEPRSMWSGIYATSAFGGYYIKLSQDGQSAVIAERYS